MGLMNSIVSIGTVTLQYAINGFCPLIISAQVAARRIMSFAVLPLPPLLLGDDLHLTEFRSPTV